MLVHGMAETNDIAELIVQVKYMHFKVLNCSEDDCVKIESKQQQEADLVISASFSTAFKIDSNYMQDLSKPKIEEKENV